MIARDEMQPLERFLAALTALRVCWLFPVNQLSFAPSIYKFLGLYPQLAIGASSLIIAVWIWIASSRGNRKHRRLAVWFLLLQWAGLGGIFFVSEPRAVLFWGSCALVSSAALWLISRFSISGFSLLQSEKD